MLFAPDALGVTFELLGAFGGPGRYSSRADRVPFSRIGDEAREPRGPPGGGESRDLTDGA